MTQDTAVAARTFTIAETMAPVAILLGGVPVLTTLVMTAARYVVDGTF